MTSKQLIKSLFPPIQSHLTRQSNFNAIVGVTSYFCPAFPIGNLIDTQAIVDATLDTGSGFPSQEASIMLDQLEYTWVIRNTSSSTLNLVIYEFSYRSNPLVQNAPNPIVDIDAAFQGGWSEGADATDQVGTNVFDVQVNGVGGYAFNSGILYSTPNHNVDFVMQNPRIRRQYSVKPVHVNLGINDQYTFKQLIYGKTISVQESGAALRAFFKPIIMRIRGQLVTQDNDPSQINTAPVNVSTACFIKALSHQQSSFNTKLVKLAPTGQLGGLGTITVPQVFAQTISDQTVTANP